MSGGQLAVGNGNETWSEKLERNKERLPCQTVVVRDGPELAWLLVHVRERERETEMERDREWESKCESGREREKTLASTPETQVVTGLSLFE